MHPLLALGANEVGDLVPSLTRTDEQKYDDSSDVGPLPLAP